MKVIIIDDSLVAKEAPEALANIGHEVLGLYMAGFPEVFSFNGKVEMTFKQAIAGADIIFLDHNMPTPGDELLKQLISMMLITEETRVIGISSESQDYVKEHVPWTFLLNKPEAIKRLIEKV